MSDPVHETERVPRELLGIKSVEQEMLAALIEIRESLARIEGRRAKPEQTPQDARIPVSLTETETKPKGNNKGRK